jgi:beta-galactosidase
VETDKIQIQPGTDLEFNTKIEIINPVLWNPEHPYLYTLKTYLFRDEALVDICKNQVGVRKISLQPDGFYLNNERFFINGTNRHQEYPYIGYALSNEAQYRDAVKIKNAGFDFVRLSHYPQSEAFLNACDELGLLVMNCIPGWQFMGDEVFRKNSLNDCRILIRRDRNHPCVVFWELSLNETPMDDQFMKEANRILDEELPGNSFSAGWIDNSEYDLFIPARQHATPPDYWNYYRVGKKPVFIAEYGDWEYYAQNAGFNQPSYNELKPEERTSRQFRSDGEKRLLQQVLNFQEASNSNMKGKSTVGQANWLMFDYNRGYANDIEASGVCDIFRIPKFSYYLFRSQRPPFHLNIEGIESGPMVYIASYWQPQSSTDVRVFSNCEEVALYLNDELIECKRHDVDDLSTNIKFPPFTFSIEEYVTGTLKAIGFIEGKEVAIHCVSTPGKPYALEISIDLSNQKISKIGKDYIFVYASIIDKYGTICPENDIPVVFSVEGTAAIIGEAGVAAVLLQTQPGMKKIIIYAESKNLQEGKLIIP